jgi:spore maturation protein CgeB
MKILFVGESWYGSSARAQREALERLPGVELDDVGTDLFLPPFRRRPLRLVNRLIFPWARKELLERVLKSCKAFRPDVIVMFKGWEFDAEFIRKLRTDCAPVVNSFPDPSPQIYGERLKRAMAEYDLVISRKIFHPGMWKSVYGYDNPCVHISYGYMPKLHLRDTPPADPDYDLVMVATWRNEYEMLVRDVMAKLKRPGVRFAVGGNQWQGKGVEQIPGVTLIGAQSGAAYTEWLRRGKIVIAPVWTEVRADGAAQAGDQMTERTMECAAAHTFFIHRRTDEARQLYDEATEVPMYDDAAELARKIEYYLANDDARRSMAAAAHARAVPAYSIDSRAAETVRHLEDLLASRKRPGS